MAEALNIYNLLDDGYNPEQERDFINNLFEIETSQDITALLLHRLYKKIEDEKLEKASQEHKELFIKELLRKFEIIKKLIHDRPELAKCPNLLSAIISKPLVFAEKVLATHNNVQQQKSLHEYQQIMTTGLVTQKSILPAIFSEKSPQISNAINKNHSSVASFEKLFERNEKSAEVQKEILKSPTLDFAIKSIIQVFKEIFSLNKNHQEKTEIKINNIEKKEETQKETSPNHTMTNLEKLIKQRQEEEEEKLKNSHYGGRTK